MSGEIYVQDFAALETLFKRFYKPLRAYAFRFVNDKDLSEDIVQDVFYELWKRRESIRFEDESVKSYLFKAVYTHALNALDKKQQDVYPLKPERETDIGSVRFLLYAKFRAELVIERTGRRNHVLYKHASPSMP